MAPHWPITPQDECVIIIFLLFLNQNICCGYSKEPSQWDGSFEHELVITYLEKLRMHQIAPFLLIYSGRAIPRTTHSTCVKSTSIWATYAPGILILSSSLVVFLLKIRRMLIRYILTWWNWPEAVGKTRIANGLSLIKNK